jgi:uncharacterized protein YicC (UPF0701 family)
MAVYSMTGYATATSGTGSTTETGTNAEGQTSRPAGSQAASVTVEIRSVNGRFLDLNFRMPDELRSLEPALRDLLSASLRRGKIEVRINARTENENAWPQPQPEQLNRLSGLESTVQGWMPKAQPLSVHEILQWCKGGGITERLDEVAIDAAKRAIAGLSEAREREGTRLVAVLMERVKRLRELAAKPSRWCPPSCSVNSRSFSNAGKKRSKSRRGADHLRRHAARTRNQRAAAYAIPHRRGRGAGAAAGPPRRDHAPAQEGRRSRQTAGLSDPGVTARSEYARFQGIEP